jgi:hypothetical protein
MFICSDEYKATGEDKSYNNYEKIRQDAEMFLKKKSLNV